MLDVKISKNENRIEASGKVIEICTDVSLLIKVIYDELEGKECKDFFIDGLSKYLSEGVYAKSHEEMCELNKKKLKEEKEKHKKVEEKKDEVIEGLMEMLEMLKDMTK